MAENMEHDNGQQCNNPNPSVQTAHIHRTHLEIDQLDQDHTSARLERDGLGTDQPTQTTLAPSFSMKKDRLQDPSRRQTKERTQTPLSQLPLETPIDIKQDR